MIQILNSISSQLTTPGGYECHFIDAPQEDLKCLICLCVARDPHQHGNGGCGKVFCSSCLTEHQKNTNDCPNCRNNLVTFMDERVAQYIKALMVKCSKLDDGCQWERELGSLETHLQTSCDHALLPCPNQCKNDDQVIQVLRKDLDKHLENECPKRHYECPHCKEPPFLTVKVPVKVAIKVGCWRFKQSHDPGEHHERTTTHLETCPQVKVSCPNLGCEASVPRCEVRSHCSICEYQRVRCKYAEVGCEEKVRQKDLQEHEEDYQFHLKITTETVLEMKMERKKKAESSGMVFQVKDFGRRKKNNEDFYSPPFYTHNNGYKMCVKVSPNGSQAMFLRLPIS